MNVSEALGRIDTFLGQPVTVSGYLVRFSPSLEGPWYIQPTKEAASFQNSIQIDLTNLNQQIDEFAAGTSESLLNNKDLAYFLMSVPTWVEFSSGPPKPYEGGMVEMEGILASPVDLRFAASLKDLTSIVLLRPDHVYQFGQGIEFTDSLTTDDISVTDALNRRAELNKQQICVRCILSGWGGFIYIAPDRSSMSNPSSCILIDPEIYDSLMYVLPILVGGPYSYDYDAQIIGKFVNGGPEPFPATLKEIVSVVVQRGPYCVLNWRPVFGE